MANAASVSSMLGPTLGLLLVYFIVMGAAYYLGSKTAFAKAFLKTSNPPAIIAVVAFIGLYLIMVTISAQFASDAREFAYSVAAGTFGLALGWVLGIVISPSGKDEATEFSLLTKAISTFLTGYVLAYLKDISKADVQSFLSRPQVPFRLLIGAACCLSSLAAVFAIRRAEISAANAMREWFISYAPADPRHAQALPGDVLARGPFPSREDAMAEIDRIKSLDEFKGVTLTAVRVDIVAEEKVTTTPADDNGKPGSVTSISSSAAAAAGAGKPVASAGPPTSSAGTKQL